MSDSTSSIDRAALQHGLAQILRCYATGGLRRFDQSTSLEVSSELLQQFANSSAVVTQPVVTQPVVTAPAASAAPSAKTADIARGDESPTVVSPLAEASPMQPSAKTQLAIEMPAAPGPALQWQLPNMADDVRLAKLQALDEQVKACRKCTELVCYRRQTVFGEGLIRPKVCFFGEAPGADEDAQGRPFVGAAGRLLNDIIRAMRLTREEVYILNSLKCRPPQNRTPLPEEVNNCRPFALTQLEILQPEFIILLGAVAVRSVLQTDDSVGRLRGRFHHFHGARVVVTYHPAYLLRTPEAKKLVWADVQMVMRELNLI